MTPGSAPKRESPAQKQPIPNVARLPLISSSWPGILLNGQTLLRSKIGHVKCTLHWYEEMEQLSARMARTRHGNITVITRHDRDILDDSGPTRYAFHGLYAAFCDTSTMACVKPVSRTSGVGPRWKDEIVREVADEQASAKEGDAHVLNVYDCSGASERRHSVIVWGTRAKRKVSKD